MSGSTAFHAKYWAHSLCLDRPTTHVDGLSKSLANARVHLNPHQIDAALFAFRSPYSRGVLLADEVGLGKTIEAGLVISQKWAERRRHIILIVPATLRKQWQMELSSKFHLPSFILETKSFNDMRKNDIHNPFHNPGDRIILCSYQFAYAKRDFVNQVDWDLVVIDEAHRLRNIYKGTKTAVGLVEAVRRADRKLLLTATPLQNSLKELYGLVSIIDDNVFGSLESFEDQFIGATDDADERNTLLRERLASICKRTLRRQVVEYVPFTRRDTLAFDFFPSIEEQDLYDQVSEYLRRPNLAALPNAQRQLITLVLRKLLASSSAAIGSTLIKLADRLDPPTVPVVPPPPATLTEALSEDFEDLEEIAEEWDQAAEEAGPATPAPATRAEAKELRGFAALAAAIPRDAKAGALLGALKSAFEKVVPKGAARKAVVFTESCKTQQALTALLTANGYGDQIVLMNGTNSDPSSRRVYAEWKKRHASNPDMFSGSRSADVKAAIVEEFKDRATILLATESAAEGVNLQFCSIVINYDLPWNPQRIEQRIGRCHRYGQQNDVLVVNFLNRNNAADQRVFELLRDKFQLFSGVFGASDEVLGALENGVDLERAISRIYQDCRTKEEIKQAFDDLQKSLDGEIQARMASTRKLLLENFDEEVTQRLRIHRDEAKRSLDEQQQTLLELTRHSLTDKGATFSKDEPRFTWQGVTYHLDWQKAEEQSDTFFRPNHEVAQNITKAALDAPTPLATVTFTYSTHASALERYVDQHGWLDLSLLKADSIGRMEEHLLCAACDTSGNPIPADVALKFFSLHGTSNAHADTPPHALVTIREALTKERNADVDSRNENFFQEEADKLDRRAEDLKVGIEREIDTMDKELRQLRRDSQKTRGLQEKLDAQKGIRDLEGKRDTKKRHLFEEQDRIKADHDILIEKLTAQLKAATVTVAPVFTLRWSLVRAAA